MRSLSALALVSALTANVSAEECPMENAIYGDRQGDFELRFRPANDWEYSGFTKLVFEMSAPGDGKLWGTVTSMLGRRDSGALFSGCERPGENDPPLSETATRDCQVWSNVIYALNDGRIYIVPGAAEPATDGLILVDLGPTLGQGMLGEEPWDQFDFQRCAE